MNSRRLLVTLAAITLVPSCKGDKKTGEPNQTETGKTTEGSATKPPLGEGATPPPTDVVPTTKLEADPGQHGGAHRWSTRFGSSAPDTSRALAQTADGALVIAGYYKGTEPFGGESQADDADAYLARLSATGKPEWIVTLGGPGADTADTAAVDKSGNAFVAGSFADQLIVGDGKFSAADADDAFVGKFAPDGRRLWVKRFGGDDIDAVHHIATDSGGNVLLTGVYRDVAMFGEEKLTAAGDGDIFLAKVSADGKFMWIKSFGGERADYGRAIAIDSADNIVLLAEFSDEVSFGDHKVGSNGNRDLALVSMTADGTPRWAKSFGNNMDELGLAVTLDPAGSIIIAGSFEDRLNLGGEDLVADGRSDAFIAKYAADGTHRWSKRIGGKDEDVSASVATDQYGNVYATGWFWFEMDLGGGPLKSAGKNDIFLVKYSPEGEHLWSRRFGDKEPDFGKGIVVTSDGGTVLTGTFHITVDFGGDPLVQETAKDAPVPMGDIYLVSFER